MFSFYAARQNMVQSQLQPNGVLTPAVLDRFADVPRELFVPEGVRAVAYCDTALELGQGRALLAPMHSARMIDAVVAKPTDRALTFGGCTGYGAAILAGLTTHVTDVETDGRFDGVFRAAMTDLGYVNIERASRLPQVSERGESKIFDVMVVQGAVAEVPYDLGIYLAPLGRMAVVVCPRAGQMGTAMVLEKSATGHISTKVLFEMAAPYVPGFEPIPKFALVS
jgi:protein-L-isoaspartate(D-aspartate) O-methyltransferase